MSRPLIRPGQWSQTTTGISQPAARIKERIEIRCVALRYFRFNLT